MATLQTNNAPYTEWARPSGSADAYNKGDVVIFNGDLYESLVDGNMRSPKECSQDWVVVF